MKQGETEVVKGGVYRTFQRLGRTAALTIMRWDVRGLESIPQEGPVILASNHVSYLDPLLLSSLVDRPIRFLGKREVFELPLLGPFLRQMGSFPIDRRKPDIRAVRTALRVLGRGEVLGIFPEGTRNKQPGLLRFHEGVGWLAILGKAPVVPVVIDGYVPLGNRSGWTRPGRIRVICGEPLHVAGRYASGTKPNRRRATQDVYAAVHGILPTRGQAEQTRAMFAADE